jgi:hypothetical protein
MYPMRTGLAAVVTACALVVASAAPAADAKVNGLVTMRGKPVTGKITFHVDDQFVGAKVDADGRFQVKRVATGTYKVTIEGKGVPEKYTAEGLTQLTVDVKEGGNTFDFELQ